MVLALDPSELASAVELLSLTTNLLYTLLAPEIACHQQPPQYFECDLNNAMTNHYFDC